MSNQNGHARRNNKRREDRENGNDQQDAAQPNNAEQGFWSRQATRFTKLFANDEQDRQLDIARSDENIGALTTIDDDLRAYVKSLQGGKREKYMEIREMVEPLKGTARFTAPKYGAGIDKVTIEIQNAFGPLINGNAAEKAAAVSGTATGNAAKSILDIGKAILNFGKNVITGIFSGKGIGNSFSEAAAIFKNEFSSEVAEVKNDTAEQEFAKRLGTLREGLADRGFSGDFIELIVDQVAEGAKKTLEEEGSELEIDFEGILENTKYEEAGKHADSKENNTEKTAASIVIDNPGIEYSDNSQQVSSPPPTPAQTVDNQMEAVPSLG